jgi:ubiquinone/menaquinone biosynthesis C-methylase UbiE
MLGINNLFHSKTIFYILVGLSIIALVYHIYKISTPKVEGFAQIEKFVLKQENKSYDDFYAKIYDSIHLPESRVEKELVQILNTTSANENSVFLDVGCGTGCATNELVKSDHTVFGVDKSSAMVNAAKSKYGDKLPVKQGDVCEPMLYDPKTFSHILCLYFTIYEIQDKPVFFTNCRYWLKNGGQLILHLVDKKKFNTVVPAGNPALVDNPQKYVKDRITKTNIDFGDFKYQAKYDIPETCNNAEFCETFTDLATQNKRQNNRTLYMEEASDIIKMAQRCGFSLQGRIDMGTVVNDEYQYLYILE